MNAQDQLEKNEKKIGLRGTVIRESNPALSSLEQAPSLKGEPDTTRPHEPRIEQVIQILKYIPPLICLPAVTQPIPGLSATAV